MAQCSGESMLDYEIMQELYANRLWDTPNNCQSDKNSNDEIAEGIEPSTLRKSRKWTRLEVSDSDVNIDDDDDVDLGWTKNDDLKI
jgi:hypothetical protein